MFSHYEINILVVCYLYEINVILVLLLLLFIYSAVL